MANLNRYQGDLYVYMTPDGMRCKVTGGQPVMDAGVENQVLLRLIPKKDWFANAVLNSRRHVKQSRFRKYMSDRITVDSINNAKRGAIQDVAPLVSAGVISKIEVDITNKSGNLYEVVIRIFKPSLNISILKLQKHGQNWIAQIENPAHGRI